MLTFKGLKKIALAAGALAWLSAFQASAQELPQYTQPLTDDKFDEEFKDYRLVYEDSALYEMPTQHEMRKENLAPYQVVTNTFGKNWFAFATAGYHTFRGDNATAGKFWGTCSPDFGIGIGKWFTPGIALKIEFIRSESKGYTDWMTGHYGYGDPFIGDNGEPYRHMKTRWWDISASAILNLSRLFLGYEGYNSPRLMNQFMLSAGIGGVHHLGYGHSYGSDNEWSGHLEFQYSRFFNRAKRFSLDLKARGIFYQSNFDLQYGQGNTANQKWDCNLGIDVGFTFYLDRKRDRGWKMSSTHTYTRDYSERRYRKVLAKEIEVEGNKWNEITFYVFYPNNYSGRNDAPQIPDAQVNAIDYLTAGIFTQKRYTDNANVAQGLLNGSSLSRLHTQDIPTEAANSNFDLDFFPRGYEMGEGPISLSTARDSMVNFRERAGYYYAPIYGDKHLWHYRIDDATLDQKLLSEQNYYETNTFGLNAKHGLDVIRTNFETPENEFLVSLADMYAALTTNEGHISDHADENTVAKIRDIIDSGVITSIHVEGLATSQDNYTGPNAREVGLTRNSALSENRAQTVIAWLKQFGKFQGIDSKTYRVNSFKNAVGGIGRVDDPSTRGLNAKLNRCVKVHIQYMIPPKGKKKS